MNEHRLILNQDDVFVSAFKLQWKCTVAAPVVPCPAGVRLELFSKMVIVAGISAWCVAFGLVCVTCRRMSYSAVLLPYFVQLKQPAAPLTAFLHQPRSVSSL